MKKIILAVLLFSSLLAMAQKNAHKVGIGANLGLPVGEFGDSYQTGYGGYLKILLGVTEAGHITFTTGYSNHEFNTNGSIYYKSGSAAIIPILGGYRHSFNGFYVEPQIGVSNYRLNFTGIGGSEIKDNEMGFTFCAGIGYSLAGFDMGIRYEGGTADVSRFSLVGFRLGYNFSFSKSMDK